MNCLCIKSGWYVSPSCIETKMTYFNKPITSKERMMYVKIMIWLVCLRNYPLKKLFSSVRSLYVTITIRMMTRTYVTQLAKQKLTHIFLTYSLWQNSLSSFTSFFLMVYDIAIAITLQYIVSITTLQRLNTSSTLIHFFYFSKMLRFLTGTAPPS